MVTGCGDSHQLRQLKKIFRLIHRGRGGMSLAISYDRDVEPSISEATFFCISVVGGQ